MPLYLAIRLQSPVDSLFRLPNQSICWLELSKFSCSVMEATYAVPTEASQFVFSLMPSPEVRWAGTSDYEYERPIVAMLP